MLSYLVTLFCRHSKHIKTCLLLIFVIFCFINVYNSFTLSRNYINPYEYLRQESNAKTSTVVRHNSTKDEVAESLLDYEFDFETLHKLHAPDPKKFPDYNVTLTGGEVRPIPLWQRRLKEQQLNRTRLSTDVDENGPFYFLTELLQVRIYDNDKAHWTIRELKQWMHFMFLAGVEHIYICDHYKVEAERLDGPLRRYIDVGLVTYMQWNVMNDDAMWAQMQCYQKLVDRYRHRHRWQIAVDMDEYPFSPIDSTQNFLSRYLERMKDHISEISLPNYLMLGQGNRTQSKMVIDRITRQTPLPANQLVKPIYRPERIRQVNIHRNALLSGDVLDPAPDELRMLHYWGARGFESAEDERKTMSNTIEMTAMRDAWSREIENSLITFGELDAFSSQTGP